MNAYEKNTNTFEIVTVTVGSPLGDCKVNKHKQKIENMEKGKRILVSFLDKGSTRILFRGYIHIHIGKHIGASIFLGMLSLRCALLSILS